MREAPARTRTRTRAAARSARRRQRFELLQQGHEARALLTREPDRHRLQVAEQLRRQRQLRTMESNACETSIAPDALACDEHDGR